MNDRDFFEQQEALKYYCENHELDRPPQRLTAIIRYVVIWLLYFVFSAFMFYKFANTVNRPYFLVLFCVFVGIIIVLATAKSFLITVVKIYQHYAPEHIRRRCICKPSCSEYALLVLRKYNLIIALRKIYIRLFDTCRGSIYVEDYP